MVERFSYLIRGQFFGHDHTDYFQVSQSYLDPERIVGVELLAPSLTTYSTHNPAIRLFEFDVDTNTPLDYTQYRMNLSLMNEIGENATITFDKTYSFVETYGVKDLRPESIAPLAKELEKVKKLPHKSLAYFFLSSSREKQITS